MFVGETERERRGVKSSICLSKCFWCQFASFINTSGYTRQLTNLTKPKTLSQTHTSTETDTHICPINNKQTNKNAVEHPYFYTTRTIPSKGIFLIQAVLSSLSDGQRWKAWSEYCFPFIYTQHLHWITIMCRAEGHTLFSCSWFVVRRRLTRSNV